MNRGVFALCTALALVLVSPLAEARTNSTSSQSVAITGGASGHVNLSGVTAYGPATDTAAEGQQRRAVPRGSSGRSGGSSAGRSGGSGRSGSPGRGGARVGNDGRAGGGGRATAPGRVRSPGRTGEGSSARAPQTGRNAPGRPNGRVGTRAPGENVRSGNAGRGNVGRSGMGPGRRPADRFNVRANQGGRAYSNIGRRAVPRARVYGRGYGVRGRDVYVTNRYYVGSPYRGYYAPGFSVGIGYYDPYYGYGYPYGYGYGYGTGYAYADQYAYGVDVDDYIGRGWLRLIVEPRHADVIVDGYHVGVVDDFDGAFQSLELAAGPHRIEIMAPGFRTLRFDVRILPDRRTAFEQILVPLP